jgi:hypothetical protein
VAWAYRGVSNPEAGKSVSGNAGNCEVNVYCPEGDSWREQKQGVVRIQVKKLGALYWCTGSLVNNTRQNKKPYILTADHCGFSATTNDLSQWIFYFNFEAPSCTYAGYVSPKESITGAKTKAHGGDSGDNGSDFYLVLLNQSIPDTFHAYLNGWDRKDTASNAGVGIHHPQGDVKKISTYTDPLVSTNYMGGPVVSHWKVVWAGTSSGHGVTEGGSSGSPIFNNQGLIVGSLTGGYSMCDSGSLDSPDYYGKMSYSWASNGTDSTKRLDYWLDPDNTGVTYLPGTTLGIENKTGNPGLSLFPNPFTDRLNLSMNVKYSFEIRIYDRIGCLCFRYHGDAQAAMPVTIYPAGLSPGVYLLQVTTDQSTLIRKIIKQ